MFYGVLFEAVLVSELQGMVILACIFEQTTKLLFININVVIIIYLGFVWETGFPEFCPYFRLNVRLSLVFYPGPQLPVGRNRVFLREVYRVVHLIYDI